jgi:hypothetical protein
MPRRGRATLPLRGTLPEQVAFPLSYEVISMMIYNVSGVVLALAAAGCAVSSVDAATQENEELSTDEGALKPSGLGAVAGRFNHDKQRVNPNTPPIAGLDESCGGFTLGPPPQCAKGLFCKYRIEDVCGFADAPGTCAERPVACLDKHAPVCGCDGQTYTNVCTAALNGVSIIQNSPCGSSPTD